ncbi:MAG TPA: CRISPR-associated protein [Cyanobacteria bacterium UBA11149]|nr:CRISPR-associated protein [Cyanobacteria bacterium UBA11367]HBE60804.1 CRISPR-associated protein [Cyanobacteria bacterium UBA11366]HBK66409.1 CRISPR-associated protein [Cyanobacteria bacterium UBA11166]HBR73658.1 CRISPR-associated protein [Cyanobacteria bacterium UBA11159]HBS72209.1 CRISPR-associated protein [Cyanobacteria bacterium UBA11153]HBW90281.1 CRISPR-associated protein [Cyanobacteria bacterium UBA11149]HCA98187.1 CRISPR-associated protein [Cyanobacteria bacterium UBA9226]
MQRLIISTVGTSILTNQINMGSESDWSDLLEARANDKEFDGGDILEAIEELTRKAKNKLYSDPEQKLINDDIDQIRSASAELNGIYGLYRDQLSQGNQDIHWLITTDTAQGQVSAELIRDFLRDNHLIVDIHTPKDLSTASTESFTNGIDDLLKWVDEIIPGYQNSDYHICFNLVGGFKALQGYANTIGMFYAHEIIYIFEGSSEVITIPRLPIQVNHSVIKPVQFALMAGGAWVKLSELENVPETLIFKVDDTATLTTWGRLVWNRSKEDLLSGELLKFPKLKYESSFKKDYESTQSNNEKVKLQETLAKASHLLMKHNGDTAPLKSDGGLLYEVYQNKGGIAHFRITQGIRVSCTASGGFLTLRRYGKEPDVNKNP